MRLFNDEIRVTTTARTDIIDLTPQVTQALKRSSIHEGFVTLFIPGSTAALTTIEFETGVMNDLRKAIEKMAPENAYYEHNERWGDGNGYSHVRAALLGPSLLRSRPELVLQLGADGHDYPERRI